jgi:hypothetical protein
MENILLGFLILSLVYNLVQGVMLYKMSQWLEEDKPPF